MNHWSLKRRGKKAKRWSQERKNTRDENLGLSDQGEVMGVPNTQHPGSLQKPEANTQAQNSLTMQFCY